MAMAFVLLILSLATPSVFAAQHVVGGSSGWSLGVNYATWASSQTFAVGDTLLFTYGSSHTVDVVSQSDYNNCNINSPPLISHSGGSTVIPLTSAGPMYFICGTPGHCTSGMKLSVTVSAATSGSSAPGASPSPPPPPTSATSANFGGKMSLLMEFLLLVVAFVGFTA